MNLPRIPSFAGCIPAVLASTLSLSADPAPYGLSGVALHGLVYESTRSDEFDGSALDTVQWEAVSAPEGGGYLSYNDGTNNLSWLTVDSRDVLKIEGKTTGGTAVGGCWYTGAGLRTRWQANYEYGYGYYELCARFPGTAGWSTSFGSNPAGANSSTTFDIVRYNSAANNRVNYTMGYACNYAGLAWRWAAFGYGVDPDRTNPGQYYFTAPTTADDGFHHYGMQWTPEEMIWYVDGVEVNRTRCRGPLSPVLLRLVLRANPAAGNPPANGAVFYVDYFRYWSRDYDIGLGPPDGTGVNPLGGATPADEAGGPAGQPSEMAFNHRAFAWSGSYPEPAASTAGIRLGQREGYEARWTFPGALNAGPTEVFAWNPAMYTVGLLSPDYPYATGNPVTYTVHATGGAGVTARTVDQIDGGQRWAWLGVFDFTSSGYVKVAAAGSAADEGVRAGMMMFRRLDDFFDDFSGGSISGWTTTNGAWSVSGGSLYQSHTGASVMAFAIRSSAPAWADGFVRGKIRFPAGATSPRSLGIVGRYQSGGDHYLLRLEAGATTGDPCKLGILKRVSGAYSVLSERPLEIDAYNDFVDLHLFMEGTKLKGLIDGQLVLEVIDASPISSAGAAGVRCYGGAGWFDSLGEGR